MRLLVTGGGTGGHVYPLVAVLERLAVAPTHATNERRAPTKVLYVGRAASVEEKIASELQIPFARIRVGGLRGMNVSTQARNLSQMAFAARAASDVIAHFKPNVVLATGGYVSAPVLWAAWRKKIPIVIELPDLEPGWAIRATWRLSRQVAVSFAEVLKFFARGRATVTGYPVRAEFFEATRERGRAQFEFDAQFPVVTVFGGSQGAQALNQAVRMNLRELLEVTQLVHICGARDFEILQTERAALGASRAARYQVFEYLKQEMPLALAAADVVVARAGAATLGEFPAVGAASILVPGLFAQGHQEKNADFLAARGAAVKLRQENLNDAFVPMLKNLLGDETRLRAMRVAVKSLARPDAAERIGDLLYEYAR